MLLKITLILFLLASPVFAQPTDHVLTWQQNSTNEDGFKIERKLGTGGTYEQVGQVGKDITTFVDTAPDEQVYFYRVKAFNIAGESPYSNEDPATGPIGGPTQLIITKTVTTTTTTTTIP